MSERKGRAGETEAREGVSTPLRCGPAVGVWIVKPAARISPYRFHRLLYPSCPLLPRTLNKFHSEKPIARHEIRKKEGDGGACSRASKAAIIVVTVTSRKPDATRKAFTVNYYVAGNLTVGYDVIIKTQICATEILHGTVGAFVNRDFTMRCYCCASSKSILNHDCV
jgi:hypothetical protein